MPGSWSQTVNSKAFYRLPIQLSWVWYFFAFRASGDLNKVAFVSFSLYRFRLQVFLLCRIIARIGHIHISHACSLLFLKAPALYLVDASHTYQVVTY